MNPSNGSGSPGAAAKSNDGNPVGLAYGAYATGSISSLNQETILDNTHVLANKGRPSQASVSSVDLNMVASRCSVRLIHDIVSKFSPEKVELVRSIGFGGLLHLPQIKQINLRFSTWLLGRVDERTQTLSIADGLSIQFDKHDVARVFGIPAGGSSVFNKTINIHGCSSHGTDLEQPIDTKHLRSIKFAQAIVSRVYEGPMPLTEQDEFCAAFVVLVMSTLLAPNAKHDRVPEDYIHTLHYPRRIGSYDWSEYVLRRLLDAATKLKADVANNVKVPYIHGCSLFLQVLYLDSIDLGLLSMEHNVFPRIRCFTADRLKSMIATDDSFSAIGTVKRDSPRTKLRNADEICYHWANLKCHNNADTNNQSYMLDLWEISMLMTRVLKIPPESAGPLFIAASDFQRQVRSGAATDPMVLMKAMLHIMEPFANGFSYQASINASPQSLDICCLGTTAASNPLDCCYHVKRVKPKRPLSSYDLFAGAHLMSSGASKKPFQSSDGTLEFAGDVVYPPAASSLSHRSDVPRLTMGLEDNSVDPYMMAIISMSRFYLTIRPVKSTRCSDRFHAPLSKTASQNLPWSSERCAEISPRSPWELGACYNIDPVKVDDIFKKLSLVEDTDVPWIAHFCPKYIEVLTCALKAQFSGGSEFETELFDAVIRRYKQRDEEMYANEGPARWRHFVESDFMGSLLAGWFDIADPVLRSHFCGHHITYDITACRILFFPFILHYRWVCFVWRLHDNTIVVCDPSASVHSHTDVPASFVRIANLLKFGMKLVSSSLIHGWCNEWQDARLEIFNHGHHLPASINRSGISCLHFIRCFDGQQLRPPIKPGEVNGWAAMILEELMELSGNLGSIPQNFK